VRRRARRDLPGAPAGRCGCAAAARRGQGGFALLVALFVVFLLAMALSLVGLSLALRLRLARDEARGTALAALCDAALAETLANFDAGRTAGIDEHPFGGGKIGSQVETIAPRRYRITATARFAGRSRAVLADAVRDDQGTYVLHWRRLPL